MRHPCVAGVERERLGSGDKVFAEPVISERRGRILGLGAAWYEREHAAYGVPFPPLSKRFERLEETLQIVRQMWSTDDSPYTGRHYRLAETINSPQPLHPVPIMIDGGGEKKTLRLVARYSDATNLFARPDDDPGQVRAKLDVLAAHCEREGPNFDRIRKTVLWAAPVAADPEGAKRFVDQLAGYARIGIEEVHVMPMAGDPVAFIEAMGEHVTGQIADL